MAGSIYRLDVYDTAGTLQAVLTDFTFLAYTKTVNAPGLLRFGLAGDHGLLSSLADKWQVEVWRKPEGAAWGRDFAAIYRTGQWTHGVLSKFTATCPGLMHLLQWRIVAWKAGTASRSVFASAKAETIMKTLASYNAAAAATTGNGRIRDGAIPGLTVATDGAAGNTLDWNCAYDNLLETLQKLSMIAGGDFDLVKTSATAWEFRWYTGQLGTDRTATVVFALERGNMGAPQHIGPRVNERTAAIVAGQGEEADRATVVRTGANYNASTNNIEMFVNASNSATTGGLNAQGDRKLAEAQARESFDFQALQAPATLYGVHYFLGDLVAAVNPFTGASLTLKVNSVSISLDESGQETIELRFVTV